MNWCDELWPAGHILIKLVCGSNWAKIRTAAAAARAHAKENYSIASHMRFHHLIVIQTFLCQPKFLPCVKTIFQIQTQPTKVYKLTKLNSTEYIEVEVEKLSHLIGFFCTVLMVKTPRVHLSKREHVIASFFTYCVFQLGIQSEFFFKADLWEEIGKFSRCF